MLFSPVSALFMVDAVHVIYLWHGWWPSGDDSESRASTTGSAETRWSNDKRLSMETIKSYATGDDNMMKHLKSFLPQGGSAYKFKCCVWRLTLLLCCVVLCWNVFQSSCLTKEPIFWETWPASTLVGYLRVLLFCVRVMPPLK